MFKADQVEQLRSELSGGGEHVDLGVSDSGGMIDLVDTTAASGTSVTLADSTGQGTSFGSRAGTGAGMKTKDDTALAADLGLSGTSTGIPSPARVGPSGTGLTGLSGGASGSRGGINVFGADELPGVVDPSAQTSISPMGAQEINLESVGSGSGLLDLSRERDDTSLGAVLEEIGPSGVGRAEDTGVGHEVELEVPSGGIDRGPVMPVYVQAADPWAPAFGLAALGAALVSIFGIFVLVCGILGTSSDLLKWFDGYKASQLWLVLIGGIAISAILFVIGAIAGKARTA
jgi:hypothetical protein